MSEPIIIKTPAPPTRERLVLVPEGVPPRDGRPAYRDATPDDLERGGYVPVERAEKAEWSARVARMALANEHQDREGVRIRKDLGTQDAPCPCDTDPEQGMGMHSPPCPLHEAARALRRKTSWEDAAHTMDGELKAAITRAEKAERELEVAMRERNDAIEASSVALSAKSKAERERDEARRVALDVVGSVGDEGIVDTVRRLAARAMVLARTLEEREKALAALARANLESEKQRNTLRAELARLTLVDEEEPTDAALRDAFAEGERKRDARHVASPLRIVYRLGVAHERARHAAPVSSTPVTSDRATDEELVDLYRKIYETHGGLTVDVSHDDCRRAAVAAVAARVRQERCLVAHAVAANVDIRVCEDDGGGFMVGVHAPGCDEELARCVPAADVPATLARLLGEVSRG